MTDNEFLVELNSHTRKRLLFEKLTEKFKEGFELSRMEKELEEHITDIKVTKESDTEYSINAIIDMTIVVHKYDENDEEFEEFEKLITTKFTTLAEILKASKKELLEFLASYNDKKYTKLKDMKLAAIEITRENDFLGYNDQTLIDKYKMDDLLKIKIMDLEEILELSKEELKTYLTFFGTQYEKYKTIGKLRFKIFEIMRNEFYYTTDYDREIYYKYFSAENRDKKFIEALENASSISDL